MSVVNKHSNPIQLDLTLWLDRGDIKLKILIVPRSKSRKFQKFICNDNKMAMVEMASY